MSDMAVRYEGIIMDERRREMHDGNTVFMVPPEWNHTKVGGELFYKFRNYLGGKSCVASPDGTRLIFSEKDWFIPDMMVICNKSQIKRDGVHGAPDLVVEVLSPTTGKTDRGYKKNIYGKYGVPEYWLVDTENRAIEVYMLVGNGLELDNVYSIYPDYMLKFMTDEERSKIDTVISPLCLPELRLSLDEIFEGLI